MSRAPSHPPHPANAVPAGPDVVRAVTRRRQREPRGEHVEDVAAEADAGLFPPDETSALVARVERAGAVLCEARGVLHVDDDVVRLYYDQQPRSGVACGPERVRALDQSVPAHVGQSGAHVGLEPLRDVCHERPGPGRAGRRAHRFRGAGEQGQGAEREAGDNVVLEQQADEHVAGVLVGEVLYSLFT